MRVVVQKENASVEANNQLVGEIKNGLMVYEARYESSDTFEDISWMVQKIIKMRILKIQKTN